MGLMRGARRLAASVLAFATPVAAQSPAPASYPDRPIKLIVPFPPGGVYDSIARPLADRLKGPLGTLVIENVGGAAGARGAMMTARAPADGYTLMLAGSSMMVVLPLAAKKPSYDPVADFEPLARIAIVGLSLVAHTSAPVSDLASLVTYAKANPGKLSYGSPGAGTTNHLTGELFKILAQAPGIVHVPYSGAGPALNDLVGGHIPLAFVNVTGQVVELRASGKIRMLVITTPQRIPQLPDVPTAAESGLPDLQAVPFYGLFAPKGMSQPAIERIVAAVNKVLADPELRALYDKAGFQTDRETSPAAFRSFLAADLARWKPVIEATGFKID